jgi:hypothetical protein
VCSGHYANELAGRVIKQALTEASPCKEKNVQPESQSESRGLQQLWNDFRTDRTLICQWPMKNRLAAHQTFWVRLGLNGSKNKQETRHHLFPSTWSSDSADCLRTWLIQQLKSAVTLAAT